MLQFADNLSMQEKWVSRGFGSLAFMFDLLSNEGLALVGQALC